MLQINTGILNHVNVNVPTDLSVPFPSNGTLISVNVNVRLEVFVRSISYGTSIVVSVCAENLRKIVLIFRDGTN